ALALPYREPHELQAVERTAGKMQLRVSQLSGRIPFVVREEFDRHPVPPVADFRPIPTPASPGPIGPWRRPLAQVLAGSRLDAGESERACQAGREMGRRVPGG